MDLQPPSISASAGDCDNGVPSSASTIPEKPAKKPTRQWAAWTRQEEENFFNALRQVGKNFEKITCRVQSKNKDQVRHYYYRLVRRMNKLLGPEFGLDARNSKDTIAAMLRWWSLLEKYSCTASKLHLKPRRFKTFIEALAHQLLKDRNKSRRKRLSHGESFSSSPETSGSILHGTTNESHTGSQFLISGQINQKVGATRNASAKVIATNETCSRVGPLTEKITKPRRRTNLVASAAYKRWEKAAIAGVSMVADAAEQLELSNNCATNTLDQVTSTRQPHKSYSAKSRENATFSESAKESICKNFSKVSSHQLWDIPAVRKLKLQLFPLDEYTRKALEKDQHNPYLELTLSSRKRISSILEHLHRKWGNSGIALGELTLLPYNIYPDPINCQRWTYSDKSACAGDIYASVGSPSIFRLRYGWLLHGLEKLQVPTPINVNDSTISEVADTKKCNKNPSSGELLTDRGLLPEPLLLVSEAVYVPSDDNMHDPMINLSNEVECMLKDSREHSQTEITNTKNREVLRPDSGIAMADEWTKHLPSISVGELLLETSRAAPAYNGVGDGPINPFPQQAPFTCDSFDAAIAAHVTGVRMEQGSTSCEIPRPSIWDAEETCDGFSFCMGASAGSGDSSGRPASVPGESSRGDVVGFLGLLKRNDVEPSDHVFTEAEAQKTPESDEGCIFENPEPERILGVTDMDWTDSLGGLDLDNIPSQRYVADDIFLGESISIGLSRLMANSLDAFQNCSFFSLSLDKRESSK